MLRQERLRKGLDLTEVASQTRISERFLQALEADDYESLPGNFFARSFVRQYATLLGVWDEELERRLLDTVHVEQKLPTSPLAIDSSSVDLPPIASMATRPRSSSLNPFSIALFLLVLIGSSALYVLYQRSREPAVGTVITEEQPAQSGEVAAGQPTTATAAGEPARPAAGEPGAGAVSPTQDVAATPAPGQQTPSVAPPPQAPAAEPPQPTVFGSGNVSVVVTASEQSWVEALSDGRRVFAGTLEPGETRTFRSSERTVLTMGNAGGVNLSWNGQPVGTVGNRGQVRAFEFTPERFGPTVRPSID
jgi:cytoskeleton protein RodZ